MNDMKHIPTELFYIGLAIAGGVAKYLSSYKEKHGKFAWGALVVASVISGFSGYMFALFASSLQLPEQIVFMFAGMGGFLGEYGLRFLGEYVLENWFSKYNNKQK